MYEELVKRLRTCGNSLSCNKCKWRPECDGPSEAMRKAADAIEELNRYVQQMEKLRKEGWYLQKTKIEAYGQAIMTMPLPDPLKEET